MKQELKRHLLPLLIIFVISSLVWVFNKAPWYQYPLLFVGLGLGSFFLDLDHIIYWLYINPNIEESRLAQIAIHKYDFKSVIKLLESTHKKHTNLIFHHFFFQVVLSLLSFFIFTSSTNIFAMSFILAMNIHLIVDEVDDLQHNKQHLQDWLFAREAKQLPIDHLQKYVIVFAVLSLIFLLLFLRTTR